jgi:CcmD family protein
MTDKLPSQPAALGSDPKPTPVASTAPATSGSPVPVQDPRQGGGPERSTEFKAVEGGNEVRSGAVLMIEAYALVWTFLLVWVFMLWRRQKTLDARIDGLDAAIGRAIAAKKTAAK